MNKKRENLIKNRGGTAESSGSAKEFLEVEIPIEVAKALDALAEELGMTRADAFKVIALLRLERDWKKDPKKRKKKNK